ncbi:MAG: tRNA (adenosine(37)-N6)-dimethylallyltransferase MiaA [Pirellulales bacterium]
MITYPPIPDAWFLTGPTAAGKTALSLAVAGRLNAEIVSLDSMAVYRGMDIGTAKPNAETRAAVPHHLLDLVEPTVDFSVSEYLQQAHQVVAELHAAGKQALFVGGTPLYLKALLRGMFEGPNADWEFRQRWEAAVLRDGLADLRAELGRVDPASLARIHENDARRMIRALEVYHLTGEPLSRYQQQFERGRPAEQCRVFVLDWPRPLLHARINQRVRAMFKQGLIDEVRGLLARHGELGRTAAQALGYREALAHLGGEYDAATAIEQTAAHTRQFARRQLIWFRGLSECRWTPMQDVTDVETLADELCE